MPDDGDDGVPDGLRLRHFLDGHSEPITDLSWSPNGQFLASASYDRTIRLWDPDSGDHNRTRVLVYRQPLDQAVGGIAELPDAAPAQSLAASDAHRGARIAYALIAATIATALASMWLVRRRARL